MEKTIAVRLKGGLGNQLFQYAAGQFLANSWQRQLVLLTDLLKRPVDGYTTRHFELDQFGFQRFLADPETERKIVQRSFFSKIGWQKRPLFVSEANFFTVRNSGQQVILDGYFQSEKYFASIQNQLVKELKTAFESDPEFLRQQSAMQGQNSVAIHVRRGDYVSLPSATQYHGVLNMDYFNKAISYIKQREREPRFFVFSDDIPWCIQNFPSTNDFVFQTTENKRSATDLMLMSQCKHQVISNSSYSWWSAWLNENKNKIVIAPKNWFNDPDASNADIYCNGWLRL